MKVILFGATGMIGQGVLRECLLDTPTTPIEKVLIVGRSPTRQEHDKIQEIVLDDLFKIASVRDQFAGYDACFFCLGTSAGGLTEAEYRHITHDLTLAVAQVLVESSPNMTFIYVSGSGTDATEKKGAMWARVKGATENALLKLPFKRVVMFRPAFIQPLHGATSRTRLYRIIYAIGGPFYPLWKLLFPKFVTTTEQVGRAMLIVAKQGAPRPVLENHEINEVASQA